MSMTMTSASTMGLSTPKTSASICESIHLLFDNVSSFANPPGKKFCPFHDRYSDFGKPKSLKHFPGSFFNKLPLPNLIRKDVIKTTDRFDFHEAALYPPHLYPVR